MHLGNNFSGLLLQTRTMLFAILFLASGSLTLATHAQSIPKYKVDSSWPKELPNNWILGNIHGVAVDKDNHIWVLSSPRVIPPDQAGAVKPSAIRMLRPCAGCY